ncbi:hypothetical protein AEA09_04945 [Lysinibacillus contaminans]|uniref:Uncharacterized protein n=1 Tax=Lysinibacillus contaminans TaxID=1293441 RepID=A0ABR5JZR3_9BACI|nr:hypothetical protein AEA09_04945 [Lysinibacillus contaminans]
MYLILFQILIPFAYTFIFSNPMFGRKIKCRFTPFFLLVIFYIITRNNKLCGNSTKEEVENIEDEEKKYKKFQLV